MTTTYHLNANELSVEIINSIKAAFVDKDVEITVTEAIDETQYLLSSQKNREQLESSVKELSDGEGMTFTVQELEEKYGNKWKQLHLALPHLSI